MRNRRQTPTFETVTDAIEDIEQDIKPPRGRLTQILIAVLVLITATAVLLAKVMGDQRQEAQTAQATAVAQVTALSAETPSVTATVGAPEQPSIRPNAPFSGTQPRQGEFNRLNAARTRSMQLAYTALAQLENDPELSLLVALEANQSVQTPEAVDALRRALQASHLRLRLQYPGEMIRAVAFAPSGDELVTIATAGPARVWDAHTGKQMRELDHPRRVLSALYSPDGRFIVTTSTDKIARLWDAARGDLIKTLEGHEDDVTSAIFSSDARRVVTGSKDGTARIWHTEGFSGPLALRGNLSYINHVEWSADDQRILATSEEGLCVWNAESGKQLFTLVNTPAEKSIMDAHFSPDGKLVVVTGAAFVRLLDGVTGQTTRTLEGTYADYARFSPYGGQLLTGGVLWDVTSWQAIARFHNFFGFAAQFSPTGRYLVTEEADTSALYILNVWDVRSRQWPPPLLSAIKSGIGHTAAVFSPYGEVLASVDADGAVRTWSVVADSDLPTTDTDLLALARARVTRTLTCDERRVYLGENVACATTTP